MNFSDGSAPNTNVFPGFKRLRGEVLTETLVFPFLNQRGCKVASWRGLWAISRKIKPRSKETKLYYTKWTMEEKPIQSGKTHSTFGGYVQPRQLTVKLYLSSMSVGFEPEI